MYVYIYILYIPYLQNEKKYIIAIILKSCSLCIFIRKSNAKFSYMYVAIIIIKQLSFNDTKMKTHIAFCHWNSAAQSVFYIWFMKAVIFIVLRILAPAKWLFDNALVW